MKFKDIILGFGEGFKEFGNNINLILDAILLSTVYIIGVGATFLIAKLSGKKFLDLRFSKRKKSYWSKLDLKKKSIEEYYRQF